MLRARLPVFSSLSHYSQFPELPSVKLVPQLRELTEVSIAKAREALAASDDVPPKIAHRAAGERLVGASVCAEGGIGNGHVHGALVGDTDFFACLVPDVTYTAWGRARSNSSPIRTA
ncbi:hypothetical protein EDB85DRAFT_2140058 [Lactarius pseudohatsudake]|nr:hypothetical protein EDB85DRAFT_2140058 [Lactarius pseudohatsudake]